MSQSKAESPNDVADPALWLQRHGDYLFAVAMSHTANAHVAEELVQEALLAALEGRDTFESRAPLRTWLVSILKHKLVDYWRQMRRGTPGARLSAAEADLEQWVDRQFDAKGKWKVAPRRWDRGPGEALEHAELRAALAECLEGLAPRAAQTLLLTERQELSAEHVGKVLGLTRTNVGVILHRARTALRRCLEERWIGNRRREGADALV